MPFLDTQPALEEAQAVSANHVALLLIEVEIVAYNLFYDNPSWGVLIYYLFVLDKWGVNLLTKSNGTTLLGQTQGFSLTMSNLIVTAAQVTKLNTNDMHDLNIGMTGILQLITNVNLMLLPVQMVLIKNLKYGFPRKNRWHSNNISSMIWQSTICYI